MQPSCIITIDYDHIKVKLNSGFSVKYVTNYEDNLYAVLCLWNNAFKQMESNA